MHTLKCQGGTTFRFNDGMSGYVVVAGPGMPGIQGDDREVLVPGADLLSLVAHYVTSVRVAEVEWADASIVLGVPVPDLESEGELRAQENQQAQRRLES